MGNYPRSGIRLAFRLTSWCCGVPPCISCCTMHPPASVVFGAATENINSMDQHSISMRTVSLLPMYVVTKVWNATRQIMSCKMQNKARMQQLLAHLMIMCNRVYNFFERVCVAVLYVGLNVSAVCRIIPVLPQHVGIFWDLRFLFIALFSFTS